MQSWSVRNNSPLKITRHSMCVKVKWPCLAQLLLWLYGNHAHLRLLNFKSLLIWKMFFKIDLMKNRKHSFRKKDVIHVFFYKLPYMSLICNLWCNHFLFFELYSNMKTPSEKPLVMFITQFIINHSLKLGVMLYICCEFAFPKTFTPNCCLVYIHVSSNFHMWFIVYSCWVYKNARFWLNELHALLVKPFDLQKSNPFINFGLIILNLCA